MFDPNDTVEITFEAYPELGAWQCRLLSERQVREIERLSEAYQQFRGKISANHEHLNKALAVGLVERPECGQVFESLTLGQKDYMLQYYPWLVTEAELKRLRPPSASPSGSSTSSPAPGAPPDTVATT